MPIEQPAWPPLPAFILELFLGRCHPRSNAPSFIRQLGGDKVARVPADKYRQVGRMIMIGKVTRFMAVVSIAGAGPFLWFHDSLSQSLKASLKSVWPGSGTVAQYPTVAGLTNGLLARTVAQPQPDLVPPMAPAEGDTFAALEAILRFDVTDQWVVDRWPRVSTILSQQQRKGLRVPLVTGSSVTDLAGALSYYFDEQGRVRRIAFDGQTGDASLLVRLAKQRFAMRQEPSLGAGLYLGRWNALPVNGLHIRHAPVVRQADPHAKLEVHFEVNLADAGYSLSTEFLQLIEHDRLSRT